MTLEEVRAIAEQMGLKPRRSQSLREISYAILDAQADNRAREVQAKEDAKADKRVRTRGTKTAKKTPSRPSSRKRHSQRLTSRRCGPCATWMRTSRSANPK